MSEFKRKFKKAAGVALVAGSVALGGHGLYETGSSITDHHSRAQDYNAGKACKREMDKGKRCSLEATEKAVFFVDNNRQFLDGGLVLSLGILGLGAGYGTYAANRKKPDNKPGV